MDRSVENETAAPEAGGRGAATRRRLIAAAIETLKDRGFAGASARVVADRAGVNQGLVFYHFGSVVGLLLAALDEVSAVRAARHGEAVARATSPSELVAVAGSIFREDLEQGHAAVLLAMIAGAASTRALGREVVGRVQPWTEFASKAVGDAIDHSAIGSVLPAGDVGFAVVALYLGLEMLAELSGDHASVEAFFERAKAVAGLMAGTGVAMPSDDRGAVP